MACNASDSRMMLMMSFLLSDPMIVTLANIREGVKLRKVQRDPSTVHSPYSSLENSELMAKIRSIRDQTETVDDSDSESEFSPW